MRVMVPGCSPERAHFCESGLNIVATRSSTLIRGGEGTSSVETHGEVGPHEHNEHRITSSILRG